MLKYFFKFSLILTLSVILVFAVHLGFLRFIEYPLWGHYILLSYIFNLFTALFFYFGIAYVSKKDQAQTGFIYLLFIGLKFLLFFVLLYPFFNADDVIQLQEFITFFIPYASCVFILIRQLTKFLNPSS
jgi:hypothetical protein